MSIMIYYFDLLKKIGQHKHSLYFCNR